eukprot:754994-Hanusia_phi.AAC.4
MICYIPPRSTTPRTHYPPLLQSDIQGVIGTRFIREPRWWGWGKQSATDGKEVGGWSAGGVQGAKRLCPGMAMKRARGDRGRRREGERLIHY